MIRYSKSETYLTLVCEVAKRGKRVGLIVSSEKRKQEYTDLVLDFMNGAWPIGLRISVIQIDYGYEI